MRLSAVLPSNKIIPSDQLINETAVINAIIIPSARPYSQTHIAHTLQIARSTDTFLIVFCSKMADLKEIHQAMLSTGTQGAVIDIPSDYSYPLFSSLATHNFPEAIYFREGNDLSTKRNLGILLAHLMDWQNIFFLDDDLQDIRAEKIDYAAKLLRNNPLAGFLTTGFPDNSVIRHAERLSGKATAIYWSSNALAINTKRAEGFFPNIYNEDWFFFLQNRVPSNAGNMHQDQYNPFANTRRAISEEFGDSLAEGLLQFHQTRGYYTQMTKNDWLEIKSQRRNLISNINKELQNSIEGRMAIISLNAAAAQLESINITAYMDYVQSWQKDVITWQEHIKTLPHHLSLTNSLHALGLVNYLVSKAP